MLHNLFIVLLTIAALCGFNMGLDWIEIGYGLHPLIAFPLSTFSLLLCFLIKPISSR